MLNIFAVACDRGHGRYVLIVEEDIEAGIRRKACSRELNLGSPHIGHHLHIGNSVIAVGISTAFNAATGFSSSVD